MRTLRFAALFALASISAQPARAQNFIPRDALIAMVEIHKASLLRYLDASPDSMLGSRPVAGARAFAEQIEHEAWCDAFSAHTAITASAEAIGRAHVRTPGTLKHGMLS